MRRGTMRRGTMWRAIPAGVAMVAAAVPAASRAVEHPVAAPAVERKLDGAFLQELRGDPTGLHYDVLITLDGPTAASALPTDRAVRRFEHLPIARTLLTRPEILALVQRPDIAFVEANTPLENHNAEAREASGVDALQGFDGTKFGGLTGEGIHVAVIDAGFDTTHPDLVERTEAAWQMASASGEVLFVGRAERVLPTPASDARAYVTTSPKGIDVQVGWKSQGVSVQEGSDAAAHSVDPGGHGTHVAGAFVGDGRASADRRLRGVAPGARLHAYNWGVTPAVATPLSFLVESYDHILGHNKAAPDDRDIRIVNQSLGAPNCVKDPGLMRPNQVAHRHAYDAGVLILISYANSGPNHSNCAFGTLQPYVLGVGMSEKGGRLSPISSRGVPQESGRWVNYDRDTAMTNVATYLTKSEAEQTAWDFDTWPVALHRPGVLAPGARIVSAQHLSHANTQPGDYRPLRAGDAKTAPYGMLTGTSMSAPHAAGVATLVAEAYRDAHGVWPKPMRLIEILEASADPFVLGGSEPWEVGAGHLDAPAAVAMARTGLPPLRRAVPTKTTSSTSLAPCGTSALVNSWVTDVGSLICTVAVGERARSLDVSAALAAGSLPGRVMVRLYDPDGRERSSNITGTAQSTGPASSPFAAAVRNPRPGGWTVRFDGVTSAAPSPVGPPTAVTFDSVATLAYANRAPATVLDVRPEAVLGRPTVAVTAEVVDADGVDDVRDARVTVVDSLGVTRGAYALSTFSTVDATTLRCTASEVALKGAGPWTVRLDAIDVDGERGTVRTTVGRALP